MHGFLNPDSPAAAGVAGIPGSSLSRGPSVRTRDESCCSGDSREESQITIEFVTRFSLHDFCFPSSLSLSLSLRRWLSSAPSLGLVIHVSALVALLLTLHIPSFPFADQHRPAPSLARWSLAPLLSAPLAVSLSRSSHVATCLYDRFSPALSLW